MEISYERIGGGLRAAADVALLASEARYRRLFESAEDGILILEADSGLVVDVNPFMTELTGFAREEFLGRHLWEIGPFEESAASRGSFAERRGRQDVRYDDLPLKTRDGGQVQVEFISNVYLVDDKRVLQCNVRDVSARKALERVLRLRDRAVEAVSQGILIPDATLPDFPIVYASPRFTRLTGYRSGEVIGRGYRFLQGTGTDSTLLATLRATLRESRPCEAELLNFRKGATPFWNDVAVSPVRDPDGRVTHFVGVQSDVTERRRSNAQYLQAQRMEAVGRLAAGVAHDFNNLLTVILSYADLILGELEPGGPMRAEVEEMRTAGMRAAQLTKQLLAFSRQQVLETKVLNLNALLAGMEKMLVRLLGADVDLTMLTGREIGNVEADPGQVEQVVMNLAVNARDAMPGGGKLTFQTANVELDAVYARAHPDVRAGSYIELDVTDTGTGMSRETLVRVFEPFFTTKEQGKGTGLGLATVFGIVRQSGGHVCVSSEPNEGTTFKVYFPRSTEVAESPPDPSPRPTAAALDCNGGTILLVEDEDQVRHLARSILQQLGFVVLDAPNGGEALLICEQHGANIDLLLTDVVLPRMSGRQLAERLAPLRPTMKVLFVSGYTDDAILQHGVIDSGFPYLQKPFTPGSLTRKVQEVLRAAPRAS